MIHKPFAVFDIDGTLIRWQLFHAVLNTLAKQGHLGENAYESIKEARFKWKQRAHQKAFKEYEKKLVEIYFEALNNIPLSEFDQAIQTTIDEYKQQAHVYTKNLVEDLKAKGYLLFAISGSHHEAIELIAKQYGFDDWEGTKLTREGGKFTQVSDESIAHKDRVLNRMMSKFNATLKGSIGVGDSPSDISFLELVEKPIAFNPNFELFEHARKKGWNIVVERKNVVYKMEQKDGRYELLV